MVEDVNPTGEEVEAFVAFAGTKRIAAGSLAEAAIGAKRALRRDEGAVVLVFDVTSGGVVDLDLRGAEAEVLARYAPPSERAPRRGRPKLGVVPREVTLLPRHWEWLASQPGGASVALRKLVETARKADAETGPARMRVEAVYRFMAAMAGDLPDFEDAARDMFARDWNGLRYRIADWPPDIRDHVIGNLPVADEGASQ